MELNDILPILIPGAIIQTSVQAIYIRQCWENKNISQKRKVLYIILIAIFNLPAAAAYLFFTRARKSQIPTDNMNKLDIDNVTRQGIFVLLVITFEVISFTTIFKNLQSRHFKLIIFLLFISLLLLLVNGLLIKKAFRIMYCTIPYLQIILALVIYYLDINPDSKFIVLVIIASVINRSSINFSKVFSLSVFPFYLAIIWVKAANSLSGWNPENFIGDIYVNAMIYILVFSAFYSAKKQLIQNQLLESAYGELKEQSSRLEEMAAISERNRIAGEIHDNVGHSLTTAIISLEASEKLLDSNSSEAVLKLRHAREQVKNGLNSIRCSVKAIKQGAVEKSFDSKLKDLLHDLRNGASMQITDIIELKSDILPIQQKVILHAIKECATNSIKHGKSTQFDILIQEFKDNISLTISDNGQGSDQISYGFGLTMMSERVHSMGGSIYAESSPGEGFTVSITIPIGIPGRVEE